MTADTPTLRSIDWSFKAAKTQESTHGVHPYPAKFIPQIPRNLIQLFPPRKGCVVLDPFCGSGTTLVEAMRLGIQSIGIDLSPIACLVAKVKSTPLNSNASEAIDNVTKRANARLQCGDFEVPDIPRIDHWFKPEIQESLASLRSAILEISDSDCRDALLVAMSSIIVRVSNQDSDTRYAAVEKNVSSDNVFKFFAQKAKSIIRAAQDLSNTLFDKLPSPHILNQDILKVQKEKIPYPVDLVITSPPYPNAYEYWLYHKYRMFWLGMDPIAVRENEIGARPHFFKSKDPHTAEHFMEQMSQVFNLLNEVMTSSGSACFLIGRSIIKGETIDNLAILEAAANKCSFDLTEKVERHIARTRKSFNLAHAPINREHIAVFRRQS